MTVAPDAEADGALPTLGWVFGRRGLYTIGALVAAYLLTQGVTPSPWWDVPLGLVVLLVAPGYALVSLFARERREWAWPLTLVLVVVWSIAVNVGVGILFLVARLGLPPLAFGAVSLGLLAVAWARGTERSYAAEAPPRLIALFRLEGYPPAHRNLAYLLLSGIVATLLVMLYLSTVPTGTPADPTIAIAGPSGTVASLPTRGTTNETLSIEVTTGNGPTAQAFELVVRSLARGSSAGGFSIVPWGTPMTLGNGTEAQESLDLAASSSATTDVEFEYLQPGTYTIDFVLEQAAGSGAWQAEWSVEIVAT